MTDYLKMPDHRKQPVVIDMRDVSERLPEKWDEIREQLNGLPPEELEIQIDYWAAAMARDAINEKMEYNRQKGRAGWHTDTCKVNDLKLMLMNQINDPKPDMRDVMCLAMMIFIKEALS